MTIHNLKINKQPFDDLVSGRKTGEVRNCSDRDFKVGDTVELFMTETESGLATESIVRTITHVQRGYGLPADICVLSYAAPVVERQDKCGVQMVDCPECSHQWDHFFDCGNRTAPVSVVLPGRAAFEEWRDRRNASIAEHGGSSSWYVSQAHYATWEACLDKVKEMNQ